MSQKGFILPSILITSIFLFLIGTAVLQLSVNNLKLARNENTRLNSQLAVDAGIDLGLNELNQDNDYTGSGGEVEFFNDGDIRLTYEITVTDGVDTLDKLITATGRSYDPANASTPSNERSYEVDLRGIASPGGGPFSVVTGVGGLFLSNSAKIVGGDVFVNGEISMSNTSSIGLSTSPVSVRSAHTNCPNPPDSNYPRVCNSGENGEPITLTNSAHIYGEVRATNQTDGSGMSDSGLVPNQTVAPEPLPTHDRDAQKTAVETTITGTDASCTTNNLTKTWEANTKVNGDVLISKKCTVIIEGDVWITGKLEMINSAKLIVDDNLNETRPIVMVDGEYADFANLSQIISNSSDTGVEIITYWSAASCSPNCPDVTGQELFDSRDTETIILNNSAQGPESVFYARWSQVQINNSGDLGAIIGQTVKLQNTSTITFGTSVTTGGEESEVSAWIIESYKRVFN